MRHVLAAFALCVVTSNALADCPVREPISAFGHTYTSGGLVGMIRDSANGCDNNRDQPGWIAKMEDAPGSNGTPLGLLYCRQVVHTAEAEYEAQRRDCIFWYGHSIEAR
jgi:hypothetical protein